MLEPARLSRLDDPVLLDTVSTVLSGFLGLWDQPTKEAIDRHASKTLSRAMLQDEIVYLRAFTIVFVLGRELGDGRIRGALLDRFYGRAGALVPNGEGFLTRAGDYTAAIEAGGPEEVCVQVGRVFAQQLGQPGKPDMQNLAASQFAALEGVLSGFLLDATAS